MNGIRERVTMVGIPQILPDHFSALLRLSAGYITASVDLAHEYVKLGKTGKASAIYGQTLIVIRNGGPSDEVRTNFLLRYSESLATVNNVLRR